MAETFTAHVREIVDRTHDVREIGLRLADPPAIRFLPGQFISFEIARPGARFKATRAYSIISTPDEASDVRLLLNRVPDGPGSEHLFGLRVGDETSFRGPFGTFTLADDSSRDLLFVATGTGIAPIWSMLWWLAAHDRRRRATLIWGLRSERDLYFREELADLSARLPGFTPIVTLSQPKADWSGPVGRVQSRIDELVTDASSLEILVCGGSAMIADVTAILKGRGALSIRREQYYRA